VFTDVRSLNIPVDIARQFKATSISEATTGATTKKRN